MTGQAYAILITLAHTFAYVQKSDVHVIAKHYGQTVRKRDPGHISTAHMQL